MARNPSGREPERPNRHDDQPRVQSDAIQVVAGRLEEAGLGTRRFIDVGEGLKQSYDHTKRGPGAATGNYGVYCGNGLVGFDIDDYEDRADTSALEHLPSTFTVETPHGGEHRYYDGSRTVAETVRAATGGAENTSLCWGEIYAGGKYLVGPGSRITDCDKNHCDECKRHGGEYSIDDDRPIAEIGPQQILSILTADPDYSEQTPQSALKMYADDDGSLSGAEKPRESVDLSTADPEIQSEDDPERKLWKSIVQIHEHNEVATGVEVVRVLDRAEELGLNRWWAVERLMQWIEAGRLKKSHAPNRIAPAWADLPGSDGHAEGEQTRLNSFR